MYQIIFSQSQNTTPGSNTEKSDMGLRSQLIKLCTKNGSAEQARLAVHTLAAMYKDELTSCASMDESFDQKLTRNADNVFAHILKTVTSPSYLTLSVNGKENDKIIIVLSTLSALVEVAPFLFVLSNRNGKGHVATQYVIDTLIMGNGDDKSMDCREKDRVSESYSIGSRLQSPECDFHHTSSKSRIPEELSLPCRRLCSAIEFIVAYIRSTIHYINQKKLSLSTSDQDRADSQYPSKERIASVFHVLMSIISNCGQPPSHRDRLACKSNNDMSALRKCAALNIFRLCDRSLGLDELHLSFPRWRALSSVFMDTDADVRGKSLGLISFFHFRRSYLSSLCRFSPLSFHYQSL
jgi:hypothetical protein